MPTLLLLQLLLPTLLLLLLLQRHEAISRRGSSTCDTLLLLLLLQTLHSRGQAGLQDGTHHTAWLLLLLLRPMDVLPPVTSNVRLACSRHSTPVAAAIQEARMQPSQLLLLLFWRLLVELPSAVHCRGHRTAAAPKSTP